MKKFKIVIEKTISQEFEIEASDENEACKGAIDKYKNVEFVLDNSEVHYKQLAVVRPGDDLTWIEF